MNISSILPRINVFNPDKNNGVSSVFQSDYNKMHLIGQNLNKDVFIKSSVSFQGSVVFFNNNFEKTYSRNFFKKILKEGINCAYTGMRMIPRCEIDSLINTQVFRKKSVIAIQPLKEYENDLFGVERRVLSMLIKESKRYPDLKLQDLLALKYSQAEKGLIRQQSSTLDKISLLSRNLNKKDHQKVRTVISGAFDKIFAKDPLPEERFKRKDLIYQLRELNLTDKKLQQKFLDIAETLPQSSNSVNAFIVKYAQPYKIKYIDENHIERIPRTSEDLAIRLLKPLFATDEHIYPQELYRLEETARQNGDEMAKNLSEDKVTILTTEFINSKKGNMLFDDFVRQSEFDIKTNIQKHVDRLIEIDYKWLKDGRVDDANRLADYIVLLKEEFQRRSKIVDIDISEFEKNIPDIKNKHQVHKENMAQKRLKNTGRADNSHSETYIGPNGQHMENRKILIHTSRYKN